MSMTMFRKVSFFRLVPGSVDLAVLDATLGRHVFQSCGAESPESHGWVETVADAGLGGCQMAGQAVISLRIETKTVPGSAIKSEVAKRCNEIASREERKVGRKEKKGIEEAVLAGLLVRAIPGSKEVRVWIDTQQNWLVVDSCSGKTVDLVLETLRKCFDGPLVGVVKTNASPTVAMTQWLAASEAPSGFTVDMDCILQGAEGQTVRFTKHSLDGQAQSHIEEGKVAVALGMTYADRASFVLSEDGRLKKLSFVDAIIEAHQQDRNSDDALEAAQADLVFMGGELRGLLTAVVDVLGGAVEG